MIKINWTKKCTAFALASWKYADKKQGLLYLLNIEQMSILVVHNNIIIIGDPSEPDMPNQRFISDGYAWSKTSISFIGDPSETHMTPIYYSNIYK